MLSSGLRALPPATSFFSSPSLSLGHLFSSQSALCFPLHVLHPRSCTVKNTTKHGEREREREKEKKRERTTEKERHKKERGKNSRGWTRWEEDTCDFIRHPYSNGYSITCACWLRYAFSPTRGRCWPLVLVRVSSRICAIAAAYAYLRAARARMFYARIEYALVSGVGTGVSLDH